MSLANRAPVEIWQHIFLLLHHDALDCQRRDLLNDPPLSWYGVVNSSEICLRPTLPIGLSHVCQSWRALALHTPDLWTSIFIGVPRSQAAAINGNLPRHAASETTDETASQHASSIQDAFRAYLLRSAQMPLNIVLMVQNTDTFLHHLMPLSNRWRSIHITSPTSVIVEQFRQYHTTTSPQIMPLLTSFRIHDQSWVIHEYNSQLIDRALVHPFVPTHLPVALGPTEISDDPNLASGLDTRRLGIPFDGIHDLTSIISLAPSLHDLALPTYPIGSFIQGSLNTQPWTSANLTHLAIHTNPSETNTILHLLSCISQSLQVLILEGIGITRNDLLPATSSVALSLHGLDHPLPKPLLLPSLHTLCLTHPFGRVPFVDRIAIPCITKLSLSGRAPSKPDLRRLCIAIRRAVLESPHIGCDVAFECVSTKGDANECQKWGFSRRVRSFATQNKDNDEVITHNHPKTVYLSPANYTILTTRLEKYNRPSRVFPPPLPSSSSSSGSSTPHSNGTTTQSYTPSQMISSLDYYTDPNPESETLPADLCPLEPLTVKVLFDRCYDPMMASLYGEWVESGTEIGEQLVRRYLTF